MSEPQASEPRAPSEPQASEPRAPSEPQASGPPGQRAVGEQCDVCGQDVAPGEAVKAEMSVMNAMCPTAMTFHQACFELASSLWQPDPDSYCTVDPLFPETGKWVLPEDARRGPG